MNSVPDYRRVYFELRKGEGVTDIHLIEPMKPKPFRDIFMVDIDYDEVKKAVEKETEFLKSTFGDQFVKVEHVGSTSIKGMPGTILPDLIVYLESFPPTNESMAKLVKNGYKFRGIPFHSKSGEDVMFVRETKEPISKNDFSHFVLHIVPKHSVELNPMIKFRDLANSNPAIHEDYKRMKLDKYNNPEINNFFEYKRHKNDGLMNEVAHPNNIKAKVQLPDEMLYDFLVRSDQLK